MRRSSARHLPDFGGGSRRLCKRTSISSGMDAFLSLFGIYTGLRRDYNMGLESGGIVLRRAAGKV